MSGLMSEQHDAPGAQFKDSDQNDSESGEGTTLIGFLRAVNVGGTGKLPMAQLRHVAGRHGWANPRTYLASGNLMGEVQIADSGPAAVEAELERAIAQALGLDIAVMIRTRRQLVDVVQRVPFQAPVGQCHVGFFKTVPPPDQAPETEERVAQLRELVAPDEFVLSGGEVFVRYEAGQARTKLTATALARIGGSPLTVRGIRTVAGILERC